MSLHAMKEALFARGAAMGFTDMELSYLSTSRFSGSVFKGEIDKYTIAVDGGLAFRGRWGNKMGYAYTELIDEEAVASLLDGARASAEVIDSDEEQPLYEGPFTYENLNLYSEQLAAVTPEQRIALMQTIEAECFRLDPRVTLVNYCQIEAHQVERLMANTKGLDRAERSNLSYLYAMAVVKEGNDTKSAMKALTVRDLAAVDPLAFARALVDEATGQLGAEPVESRPYPVLLRRDAAASLLATYAGIFSATNVQKGRSQLKGQVGQRIGSELITLIDDPFLPGGMASRSFDSEGVPSRRLHLMEGGVLTSFLYNLKTAAVDGVASTGHGHKPSYKGALSIAPTNLHIKPGSISYDELVAGLDEGLIITNLQGLHSGANQISGDFSLAANGYYVKGGKVVRAVNQITVAGNFYQLLHDVEAVGSDLEFNLMAGTVGSPTIRIKSLAIAGK